MSCLLLIQLALYVAAPVLTMYRHRIPASYKLHYRALPQTSTLASYVKLQPPPSFFTTSSQRLLSPPSCSPPPP
ncbi:hypothetical protein F4802DRAFT_547375, partial [Xylaria palmicola]